MDDPSPNEELHRMDANLPAVQLTVPAAEVIKQILEKMLDNERRRVRNEFIRISSFILVFLTLILAGAVWIVNDILVQVKEARRMSEHSQEALLTLLSTSQRPLSLKSHTPTSTENAGEIQKTIADLESKNQALAQLMQTENGPFKDFLLDAVTTREEKIRKLRELINAGQAGALAHDPVNWEDVAPQGPAPSSEQPVQPTVTVTLPDRPQVNTLTASAADDLPLRLPIPTP